MAKVTMLKDAQGSPDHLKVVTYKDGETYDLPEFLAKVFVDDLKVAEYPGRRAAAETKMEKAAPENKSAAPADEKKQEKPADASADEGSAKKAATRRQ